jgi:3-oxo-5-alpha-steroid 4-dehydrogenase 1
MRRPSPPLPFFFFPRAGMWINIQSDGILRNLRKPGETGYKIPRGGLFRYVSGANFLGEIVEWSGFAIAAGSFEVCDEV